MFYTLSDWISLITEAGFTISHLDEPRPTPEQAGQDPALAPAMRVPFFLIFTLGITP
jgi:hypothetical protein